MKTIKTLLRNKWFARIGFVALGAAGGFAFYYFIGCNSGTCPITSNPWISTGYGALMGLVLSSGFGSPTKRTSETREDTAK
jgi:cell division protein FtsW (lipid II flippase)